MKRRRPGRGAGSSATRADDDLAPDDFGAVDPGDDGPSPRPPRRSARFAAVVTALAVLMVGGVLVGFYPTRTWLRQERAVHDAEHDLAVLREQNQQLQDEATRLQDPAEIERLARAEYNLVRPGEEAYAIIPAGPGAPTSTVPPAMMTVIEPDGRVHQVPSSTAPGYVARDPAAATGSPDTTPTTTPDTSSDAPPTSTPTTTPTSTPGG
jgi:cell division protein FtsB